MYKNTRVKPVSCFLPGCIRDAQGCLQKIGKGPSQARGPEIQSICPPYCSVKGCLPECPVMNQQIFLRKSTFPEMMSLNHCHFTRPHSQKFRFAEAGTQFNTVWHISTAEGGDKIELMPDNPAPEAINLYISCILSESMAAVNENQLVR